MLLLRRTLCLLALLLTVRTAAAQTPGAALRAQPFLADPTDLAAWRAVHGDDLRGKDGPLAMLDYDLVRLHEAHRAHRAAGRTGPFVPARLPFAQVQGDAVAVEAIARRDPEALRQALRTLGLRDDAVAGRMVSGLLPLARVPDLAGVEGLRGVRLVQGASSGALQRDAAEAAEALRYVRPSRRAAAATGSTTSQGDVAQRSDVARSTFGVDGTGVTVGVLSDSYDDLGGAPSAADDIASGDLPGPGNPNGFTTPVTVLDDTQGGVDEGRAMLQIVHDVAPGAALAFHTSRGGQPRYAQGIRDLAAAGCDVINDDWWYFAEPIFQDGVVAQAVDDVVAGGAAYFSFAHNHADNDYDAPFADSGVPASTLSPLLSGTLHDFDPGNGTDVRLPITLPAQTRLALTLQWDDPFASVSTSGAGTNTDVDVGLFDEADNLVAVAFNDNIAFGDPVEVLIFTNPSSFARTFSLGVSLSDGPAPGRLKLIVFQPTSISIDAYGTDGPTTFGHSNAAGAITVGAVAWFNTPRVPPGSGGVPDDPPVLNGFSSRGGIPILFDADGQRLATPDGRVKPDITAPDGGNNTFFGSDTAVDPDALPNFFGTSAATPHAAGVAALMLEAEPTLSPDSINTSLRRSALDIVQRLDPQTGVRVDIPGGVGFDSYSGAGLIQADAAPPLPVELTAFTATREATGVRLAWTTASETNNASFRIEQRRVDDATPFREVAAVAGAGTTTEPQRYTHRLPDLAPGRYAFRLRQVDLDGSSTRSDAVEVTVRPEAPFALSSVAPQPMRTRGRLSLEVRQTQRVRAVLYDALGRRVRTLYDDRVTATGGLRLTVERGGLASGVYLVRVTGETFQASRRVVVVR